jgi:translation initiation factor 1
VITGIPLNEDGLENLAKQLKQKCGAGGTVKERIIEIQGDHRTAISAELVKQGYKAKII